MIESNINMCCDISTDDDAFFIFTLYNEVDHKSGFVYSTWEVVHILSPAVTDLQNFCIVFTWH